MSAYFFVDEAGQHKTTWAELIITLNARVDFLPIARHSEPSEVFIQILLSILAGEPITILDSDLSNSEIERLGFNTTLINQHQPISFQKLLDETSLLERISNNIETWKLTLFTSGTTGLPKKIEHDFNTLTRWVKKSNDTRKNIWGFAYNPTHIAGLQVFFQALLNLNTIVYLFNQPRELVLSSIEKYQVTNLSATPTYLRMLMPVDRVLSSVQKVTSGGEKFDSRLSQSLSQLFPNATFRNIYASTEAGTLFSSLGDTFTINSDIAEFVKIDDKELLIHGSLLGKSDSLILDEGWYHSGDLIEVLSDNPLTFRFLSRKNELINVGGYKVNPSEVEEVLNSHRVVKLSKVYGKPNSVIGTILCAEVVFANEAEITEKELRQFLSDNLQGFKVPRIFQFKSQLDMTRTGKIKRI